MPIDFIGIRVRQNLGWLREGLLGRSMSVIDFFGLVVWAAVIYVVSNFIGRRLDIPQHRIVFWNLFFSVVSVSLIVCDIMLSKAEFYNLCKKKIGIKNLHADRRKS